MTIHATAIIEPTAVIGNNVSIGPYSYVGHDVVIGDDCILESHVVIKGPSTIGKGNHFFQFCSIGEACQDKKYAGEPTRLEIGDNNIFRESVTVHRGTVQDEELTKIGNNNLLMVNVHIAHDCMIGDDNIFANNVTIAGHVHIGNTVILGGMTAIHQFCKIGSHSFTGGGAIVLRDIPPYIMVSGTKHIPQGINSEGLKRRGFDKETIMQIKRAYKAIYRDGNTADQAVEILKEMAKTTPEISILADFIEHSARGIVR
ncbi:acyl-ACP--UDP-N-acetylglucosamine O-acyltransferase [Alteromonas sp. ASW11-36]|uniref:Acyl-[acyl-carrier-protein]--UDP-N-acetylglucosamine O-acyltransferase n=1 Tax=Alteromonas arenosi TaxID=3055817 RepID=A0ABT7SXC9_9ALTE|nr:acyl-ACP--UDP-N-acetylglucosamine O-acyltransferase [Alteromonas sp. ASW11-36]MDM7860204.1 acyl-ACP--UDP-N-acetylglucosamine O-acyltransferase [Alteromonas sp. ASW11-36]